jgi:hypothetical protein
MENMISDIPAGVGKINNLFLQCNLTMGKLLRISQKEIFTGFVTVKVLIMKEWYHAAIERPVKKKQP